MIVTATSALAGLGLGGVYFGGLWLTVRRLPDARRPGLLLVVSYLVRLLAAGGVFFLLVASGWTNLVAGLVGFLAGRWLLIASQGGIRSSGRAPLRGHPPST